MEILRTTLRGAEVNVLFTGDRYIFINSFFGIIAVAERTDLVYKEGFSSFDLYAGNSHCLGGSFTNETIYNMCSRFITKQENKYIDKTLTFNYKEKDLNKVSVSVEVCGLE